MKKRRIVVLIICLLALFAWISIYGPSSRAQSRSVERYRLPNGLTVLLKPVPESRVVSVAVVYRAGSRNDKEGMSGLSNLVERTVHQNTKNFPLTVIPKILMRTGADYRAFTSNDVTGFYETIAPDYLQLILKIEADRMQNSIISAEELQAGRNLILADLAQVEQRGSYRLWKQVRAAAYPDHPYRFPVQGESSDIRKLTLEQVRSYYSTRYQPNRAVLAVVGDIDVGKVKSEISRIFGEIKNRSSVHCTIGLMPGAIREHRVNLTVPGSSPLLHVAYRSPAVHDKDLVTIAVIDAVLTSGTESRLRKALVDGGLASSVSAWLDNTIDPGLFHIQCNLRKGASVSAVESVIAGELERLKTEDVSPAELERAKVSLKTDYIKSQETLSNQAQYLAWYEAIHSYEYLDNYPSAIDRVTAEDIRKAAQNYFVDSGKVTGVLLPDSVPEPVSFECSGYSGGSVIHQERGYAFSGSSAHETEHVSVFREGEVSRDEPVLVAAKTAQAKKPAAKKPAAKKPAAKKPAAKKPAAKKPAAKKPAAKKPAAKKPAAKPVAKKPAAKPVAKKPAVKKPLSVVMPSIPLPRPVPLKFHRHVLSNGMVLLIYENPMNPSVSVQGYIKAGGMYETPRNAGIARMTALLLQQELESPPVIAVAEVVPAESNEKDNRGHRGRSRDSSGDRNDKAAVKVDAPVITRNLPRDAGLGELLASGSEISFLSTLQNCEFSIWTTSENLERVSESLARVFTSPVFSESEISDIRSLMLSRYESEDSSPAMVSMRDFYLKIFPEKHPFHHYRWGTRETLDSLTRGDVLEFFNRHYRPESTIIAVSGNVKTLEVIGLFERHFASWKNDSIPPQLVISDVQLPARISQSVNTLEGTGRVEVVMGHKGIPRTHPDFHKFMMMNYILGGSPTGSRLERGLQHKKLVHSISSKLDTSVGDGPWSIRISVDPKKVPEAIEAVQKQIRWLQNQPPSREEMDNARHALLAGMPVQLQSNRNISSMLLSIEYYKLGDDYLTTYYNAYRNITANDIRDTARRYLHPDRMTVIVSGPYSEVRSQSSEVRVSQK